MTARRINPGEKLAHQWQRLLVWLETRRTSSPRLWAAGMVFSFVAGILLTLALQSSSGDSGVSDESILPASVVDTSPDVTVSLSAGLLSALLNQSIDQGQSPVPLENVRVSTDSGRLVVRGALDLPFRKVGGRIELEPYVNGGVLKMHMREAKLGPLGAPRGLERLAEGPINDRISAAVGGLPAEITSVRTDEQGITVTARVRLDLISTLNAQ
jgi:hypothetical protein